MKKKATKKFVPDERHLELYKMLLTVSHASLQISFRVTNGSYVSSYKCGSVAKNNDQSVVREVLALAGVGRCPMPKNPEEYKSFSRAMTSLDGSDIPGKNSTWDLRERLTHFSAICMQTIMSEKELIEWSGFWSTYDSED